jgi:hypothetical protein
MTQKTIKSFLSSIIDTQQSIFKELGIESTTTDYITGLPAAVNASNLKLLPLHLDTFYDKVFLRKKQLESKKPHFDLGSLVDIIILEGPENVDKYFVQVADIPKETEFGFIHKLYDNLQTQNNYLDDMGLPMEPISMDLEVYGGKENKELLQIILAENWQPRWKDETKIAKVLSEVNKEYWKVLVQDHRKIVQRSIVEEAFAIAEKFKESEYGKKIMEEISLKKAVNKFIIFIPDFFQVSSEDPSLTGHIKGELDNLHVYETSKEINIVIRDLKVMESPKEFIYNFFKFGYDKQSTFYSLLVISLIKEMSARNILTLTKDVTISFEYVILENKSYGQLSEPYVYKLSEATLNNLANKSSKTGLSLKNLKDFTKSGDNEESERKSNISMSLQEIINFLHSQFKQPDFKKSYLSSEEQGNVFDLVFN